MRHLQAAGGAALRRRGALAPALLALGIWLFGLAADQLTKLAALRFLTEGEPVDVLPPVLKFTLIFNPGAAFGMGEGATVLFSIFAIIATVGCLAVVLPRITKAWHGIALGLMLAGITGNLVDRMFQPPSFLHGHVVDFIQVPNFAIMNVADIFITVAAGLVIIASFVADRKEADDKVDA